MNLFDGIERTDLRRGWHAETAFSFLNRSARPDVARVRALLELWLTHYPTEHRPDLIRRFRAPGRRGHEAPFFELFLNELLLRLGFRATVHPELGWTKRHPDFFAESDNGTSFFLEAAVVRDESSGATREREQEDRIYDALNQLDSPNFFLKIQILGRTSQAPSARRIRHFLRAHLLNLDPDGPIRDGWEYTGEGWRLLFQPIAKSPGSRGTPGLRPLGVLSSRSKWVSTSAAIRKEIAGKATRYGTLDRPFVIAVNVTSEWGCDDDDIIDALFGTKSEIFRPAGTGVEHLCTRRNPDGAWRGPKGPSNTRNSAVLLVKGAAPWNVPTAQLRLFVNPHAQRPLGDALNRLPRAFVEGDYVQLVDGMTSVRVFELSERWPRAN